VRWFGYASRVLSEKTSDSSSGGSGQRAEVVSSKEWALHHRSVGRDETGCDRAQAEAGKQPRSNDGGNVLENYWKFTLATFSTRNRVSGVEQIPVTEAHQRIK